MGGLWGELWGSCEERGSELFIEDLGSPTPHKVRDFLHITRSAFFKTEPTWWVGEVHHDTSERRKWRREKEEEEEEDDDEKEV